jgi:hypothetical protein
MGRNRGSRPPRTPRRSAPRPARSGSPAPVSGCRPAGRPRGSLRRTSFSSTTKPATGRKNHSPWRTKATFLRRLRALPLRRFCAWAVWTSTGFSASLAWRTVPTGALSGMPATNQCRSSWPQRNLLLSLPSRTSSSRWRSAGCTSRTTISASAFGCRTISQNSPLRSACTSNEMTPTMRLRRVGLSATFSREPMRANFMSSRFVSIEGVTRSGRRRSQFRSLVSNPSHGIGVNRRS